MALLKPTRPEWQQNPGEQYDLYMGRLHEIYVQLRRAAPDNDSKEVVGRIAMIHVCDNYAFYVVVAETPFTIELLPYGYEISEAYVRGLMATDKEFQR